MNRTGELIELFAQSVLNEILVTNGVRHFEGEREFSKLKFAPNDLRVSSIELYDLRREPGYFRIHHHADASGWLTEAFSEWKGFRNSTKTGANFGGEPLAHLYSLKKLLLSHR